MEFRPRSCSLLFHLRMEALHRDQFHAKLRTRYRHVAAETEYVLRAAAPGNRPIFMCWRDEKPRVFDDSRKFLAGEQALINGWPFLLLSIAPDMRAAASLRLFACADQHLCSQGIWIENSFDH